MAVFKDDLINITLKKARDSEDESVAHTMSDSTGLPYIDLTSYPIEFSALGTITKEEAHDGEIATFHRAGKRLFAGILNPKNAKTISVLEKLKKNEFIVTQFIVSRRGMKKAYERYDEMMQNKVVDAGTVTINKNLLEEFIQKIKSVEDFKNISGKVLSEGKASTTRMFEVILAGAYALSVSDIHIEPSEEDIRVRYRLDGVLHDVVSIPILAFNFFKSRLKILSGVKINQGKTAQDGRFSINVGTKEIEVRVSIIPGQNGESAVLRLLDPENIKVSLKTLGYEPYLEEVVLRAIGKPNGIILLTGPTGSGKTTTLYACLQHIYTSDLKIITVENPIEYKLKGIVQTQVDNGSSEYIFGSAMRAILRQDPDVIMVGEIRDNDTADTAIQASLTGHLVFSTLHTNTAAGVIPRLIDIGVNPKILGSSLTLSLAQRLLRRICKNCVTEYEASEEEKKIIDNIVAQMIDGHKEKYIEEFKTHLYTLKKGKGCDVCNGFGYKGRLAVHEAIEMNAEMEKVAAQNGSEREIRAVADKQGFLTLREDALLKIMRGQTTLDEAKNIIDMYGEATEYGAELEVKK